MMIHQRNKIDEHNRKVHFGHAFGVKRPLLNQRDFATQDVNVAQTKVFSDSNDTT